MDDVKRLLKWRLYWTRYQIKDLKSRIKQARILLQKKLDAPPKEKDV